MQLVRALTTGKLRLDAKLTFLNCRPPLYTISWCHMYCGSQNHPTATYPVLVLLLYVSCGYPHLRLGNKSERLATHQTIVKPGTSFFG